MLSQFTSDQPLRLLNLLQLDNLIIRMKIITNLPLCGYTCAITLTFYAPFSKSFFFSGHFGSFWLNWFSRSRKEILKIIAKIILDLYLRMKWHEIRLIRGGIMISALLSPKFNPLAPPLGHFVFIYSAKLWQCCNLMTTKTSYHSKEGSFMWVISQVKRPWIINMSLWLVLSVFFYMIPSVSTGFSPKWTNLNFVKEGRFFLNFFFIFEMTDERGFCEAFGNRICSGTYNLHQKRCFFFYKRHWGRVDFFFWYFGLKAKLIGPGVWLQNC